MYSDLFHQLRLPLILLDGEQPPQRECDLRSRAGHEVAQGLLRHVGVLVVAEDLGDIGEALRDALDTRKG